MDCIFCKIAAKEIPSKTVLETENLVVIKDVNPQAPVHLLVLPKGHYPTLNDCGDKGLLGEMLRTAVEAAKKSGVHESGFRAVINTNDEGGQTVFHLHMHILGGRPLTGRMG
ncbi:MAG: histidine triad nucleotide-binding protein [Deltaproteobacteria bacterium]|nr:histidine triad nucleotide-binding protein [Deltaproteobacteria bacterium]MBI5809587.1 histidine triad nucleotide-binding protein [Deltaproteobacteria bacterium]